MPNTLHQICVYGKQTVLQCDEETHQTEARTGRAGGDSRKSLVLLISMPNAQLQRKLEIHLACTRMGMAALEGSFRDDAAQGSGTSSRSDSQTSGPDAFQHLFSRVKQREQLEKSYF
ncbi:hypothetical protein CSOJ01_07335 [Colletotrichum sojae]|uniref:Uncharacterized protein n=1 Tax=Colletotrichum sojae TaxID=2175907 RepID=A0A8H6J8Z7_9PEZI|nr:hypothetical protein CSOJ01_07335 [Colletotrichum sojae]